MPETLEQKIARVLADEVELVDYDPHWPELFEAEKRHLLSCVPGGLIRRVEHFGSTAVPGMPAKNVVDLLIEVADLEETRKVVPPILEPQGYDYFWRPAMFEGPPFYAWFIRRDASGRRTHHLHMVEKHFEHWDRLLFRDYLREMPGLAAEYGGLKRRLAAEHPGDRVAYTRGKTDFVVRITREARAYYLK